MVQSAATLLSCRMVLIFLQFIFLASNHSRKNKSLVESYVANRWYLPPSVVEHKSRQQLSKRYYHLFHPVPSSFISSSSQRRRSLQRNVQLFEKKSDSKQEQIAVRLDITLTDERIRKLYAWICQAFYGNDERYNNLMYAMVAVFGNLPNDSPILTLLDHAIQTFDTSIRTNELMGDPLSQYERERASLGAMGAAQWMGQWKTRPHALLDISNYTCIQNWEKTLPRGCKRTIQRAVLAEQLNFTVISKPIRHNHPAPHSTYEHFKCVVQHEVRLLSNMYSIEDVSDDIDDDYDKVSVLLNALSEAISRYMGTTQMTGLIREYRHADPHNNEVIAFAHEVRKGQTIRGQWFYATDTAAKQYVWFHSVRSLIERAILENNNTTTTTAVNNSNTTTATAAAVAAATSLFPFLNRQLDPSRNEKSHPITTVDLGPSGSDDFSELKSKYGFISVEDWPSMANYHGPFWDYATNAPVKNGVKD